MSPGSASLRAAAFVDRDGTIVEERRYLADPAKVSLIEGSTAALRRMKDLGLAIVLVTNQSGIGRGLYTLADYQRVAAEVERRLAEEGVAMDATRFCPDPPGGDPDSTCRKPSTAMHRSAAAQLGLCLASSYYVGDKISDVLPAAETGGTGILVRTGYGRRSEPEAPPGVHVMDDLAAASLLVERLEAEDARASSLDPRQRARVF